ncbi:MAG: YceI family protein [Ignavibacteriales bacterium]|jgi:Uncharacterized conserved protein|nr:MAG: YceI family protein [Ignavibacteriaceae bacterium]MBW7872820.1 YceI family protein [Ignavibacteria bacterium]MCZ2143539.1 YceI family protein [Ignavibacteriales bacterium]OQY71839.1 MAG: hypothetical protein B6D45_09590 [Ignavibacteriales bacterium UTCHB3]MBV6444416.1 hypothetical protein [Ignavibacteriaceae bacterium]
MATSKWSIDYSHTEIGFKVKHMMFTNLSGKFEKYEATIENEDDKFETTKVSFSADVNSITTANNDRDNHLRSADFFDAEKFPKLTFVSTGVKKLSDHNFIVTGDFTIKDVTKSIDLECEYSGLQKDPWGNVKAGATLTGKINRKDYGLLWNAALETGGVLVGDEVKINIEMELNKVAE